MLAQTPERRTYDDLVRTTWALLDRSLAMERRIANEDCTTIEHGVFVYFCVRRQPYSGCSCRTSATNSDEKKGGIIPATPVHLLVLVFDEGCVFDQTNETYPSQR